MLYNVNVIFIIVLLLLMCLLSNSITNYLYELIKIDVYYTDKIVNSEYTIEINIVNIYVTMLFVYYTYIITTCICILYMCITTHIHAYTCL